MVTDVEASCVVGNGFEDCSDGVDVVVIVVVVIFMRVAEAVVPRCANRTANDARFPVMLCVGIEVVVVSVVVC